MTNSKTEATFYDPSKPDMLWIDIETTGLDARLDVPLELGLMLTDKFGDQIGNRKWLIWEDAEDDDGLYFTAWEGMIPFVLNMHRESGLSEDLHIFDGVPRSVVDIEAVEWLKSMGVEEGKMPLSGSSVGSLDRPFVLEHFPVLNEFTHYRNIDISTLKELCKKHNPELFKSIEEIIGTKEDAVHRVIEDIGASIAEYKQYLDNFLFLED